MKDERMPCLDMPELTAVGDGIDITSKPVPDARVQTGADITSCAPNAPRYKDAVERFFRTLNQHLIPSPPVTTRSRAIKSNDHDPISDVTILYDDFAAMLEQYIINYHNNSPRQ